MSFPSCAFWWAKSPFVSCWRSIKYSSILQQDANMYKHATALDARGVRANNYTACARTELVRMLNTHITHMYK